MVKVWCEWDIGLTNRVFSSVDKAKQAIAESEYLPSILSEAEAENVDDLIDWGYLSFIDVGVD